MSEGRYWNPKTETLERPQLAALQGQRLARLVRWAWHESPFHRRLFEEAGLEPDRIRGLEDLPRLPLTGRDDWLAAQVAHPPFGDLRPLASDAAVRCHATSGSSSRTPLRVLDTRADWKWVAECWCYAFHAFGIRPRDRVLFAFSYGTSIGFWGAHNAAEKMGCLVLPSGNLNTSGRVRLIEEMGATVLCATATYALRLAQEGIDLGIDVAGGSVQRVVLSGEPVASNPATKRMIEEEWRARAANTAGMTETGTVMMFECECQSGGTHLIEDHFIEEVIDPETLEAVGYGEQGERVVTSFGRTLMPLLRYRTGELVVRAPHTFCGCGRTWDLYEGGIRGRADDMLVVRGTSVYPRAVEAVVREYPAVDEFRIRLFTADGIRDEIEVLCEVREGYEGQWKAVARRLRDDLSAHTEGLGFQIRQVERGAIPRADPSARHVQDDRDSRRM